MKTWVTVIGMGDRVSGQNRSTGKPYDFRKVAFSFVNSYGSNDVSINIVDGGTLDDFSVNTGDIFLASVVQVKNQYYIDLLEPVT